MCISSSVYGKSVSHLCIERMTYLGRKGFLVSRRNDLWCKALGCLDENVFKNHQFAPQLLNRCLLYPFLLFHRIGPSRGELRCLAISCVLQIPYPYPYSWRLVYTSDLAASNHPLSRLLRSGSSHGGLWGDFSCIPDGYRLLRSVLSPSIVTITPKMTEILFTCFGFEIPFIKILYKRRAR